MNEISRRDEVSLSGAALRGAPWKTAAISGGVAAAVTYGVGLLMGGAGLVWSLGVGISLFALVAAIGAVSKPHEGDRVTRQARLWSLRHPFKFALLPAGIVAALDYPVQLVLDGEGVFGSAVDALWHGALVYLIAGVVTLTMQGRARTAR
ncbi:unnamed protein product [[Actinomadura] parvosata subsp. kistnae]|uniref:Uncharacterized protein n=1 Tax=[Actinomadura] parvosata subsp. kistnae TaxID=1909395 RepID=A0A1V0ADW7_9ACTN|nr:hypothetical protein [Nonomuraea sp. ATCC 55076]AQZ68312.1 hypothetical protein BKM31_48745 [Nonomuraea sp. ATCC 55076]SPL93265.1 unnamed protein product [Actinomadura parvosata subsp. kistnae]